MSFWGMDTDTTREHGEALVQASRTLEELLGRMDGAVAGAPWQGSDADAFRDAWASVRAQADSSLVEALGRLSTDLDGEIEAQEQASAADGEGEGQSPAEAGREAWETLLGGLHGVADAVSSGPAWIGDEGSGIFHAIADRFGHLDDNFEELGRDLDAAKDMAWNAVAKGEWPSLTEAFALTASTVMHEINLTTDLVTGTDPNLASDGTGYADAPREVSAGESSLRTPSDLASIIQNTNTTYGSSETAEVSMTVVGHPPRGVIVNIPGTEQWNPSAGDNPLDLAGNLAQAGPRGYSAGSEATADAIQQLYADNGIPPGTPMMLNGHSQGGMLATSLASDPDFAQRYNVTNVMTYGSPVDNYPDRPGVHQLNLQHAYDVVPHLDVEGRPVPGGPGGDRAPVPADGTVTLPAPGGSIDPRENHNGDHYRDSVAQQLQDPDSQVARYNADPSMRPFLSDDPSEVTQYQARLHRDND